MPAAAAGRGGAFREWRVAPLFLLAALLLRAPAFLAAVLDPDEGLYMVQAAAWLDGGWPYVAVWDMHPPGAPALLALAHALVPDPVLALRLAGVVAVAATATGLHAIARLLGGSAATAWVAGLLYVAHSVMPGGLATNTEILFAPFIVLVARLLLGEGLRDAPPRPGVVLAAGLAAGAALLIKQVTALESAALWLTLLGVALARGRLGWGRVPVLAGLFALASASPMLGMAAGYALAGQFAPWLQGNLLAPLAYPGHDALAPGLRLGLFGVLPSVWALLVACAGLASPDPVARRAAGLLLPWLAGAAAAMAAPGKFFDHYFLILLPPLCLIGAFGLSALLRHAVRAEMRRRALPVLAAVVAAVPVGGMLMPKLAHGIGLRAEDPVRQVARLAAGALQDGEAPFVANWHPMTYALAGRRPPTRFAFPEHLSGLHPELTGTDVDAELARVLAMPPGVIVLAPTRWQRIRPTARAAIEAAVARDYRLVGTIDDGIGPVQVWRHR